MIKAIHHSDFNEICATAISWIMACGGVSTTF